MPSALLRAFLILGLVTSFAIARAQDAQGVYAKALPSIMTVEVTNKDGSGSTGTAFLAIGDGLAVTAWHVVDDAKAVTVRFSDGEEFESTGLVDKDEKRDLALIRVRVKGRPMLPISDEAPVVGSKAFVIGAPRGLEFSISEGIISAVRQMDGMRQYQYTAQSNPGNSGGPVLSPDASVLGVVSYQKTDSEGLNFAIPGTYAKAFDTTLATQQWGTQTRSTTRGGKVDPAADVEAAKKLFALTIAGLLHRGSVIDLNREATTVKSGNLRVPDSVVYAIPYLRRASAEVKALSFSDPVLQETVELTSVRFEAIAVHIEALKKVTELAAEFGWTKEANSLWRDAWASLNTLPSVWSDEKLARLFTLLPEAELAKYPRDLVTYYRSTTNPWPTIASHGISPDLRYLPKSSVGAIKEDSPLEKAGVRAGDTILEIDEKPVTDLTSLETALIASKGKTVAVKINRSKGNKTFKAKL